MSFHAPQELERFRRRLRSRRLSIPGAGPYTDGRPRRGAVRLARQAHNLEVVGSNPTAATRTPGTFPGGSSFTPRSRFVPAHRTQDDLVAAISLVTLDDVQGME